jgi:hypothetical protein
LGALASLLALGVRLQKPVAVVKRTGHADYWVQWVSLGQYKPTTVAGTESKTTNYLAGPATLSANLAQVPLDPGSLAR